MAASTGTNDQSLEDALAAFDRIALADWVQQAEVERQQVTEGFPLAEWPSMPLDRYALGLPTSSDGFCNWVERKTPHVGSIRGGSSHKLLIFKYREKPGWYFPDAYENETEAWAAVRAGFVELFARLADDDLDGAYSIPALWGAAALKVKTSFIYFPRGLLPICTRSDINHFLELFDLEPVPEHGVLTANRRLYEHLVQLGHFDGWSPYEMERFLYSWADPRKAARLFKIAPGEGALHWDDCRANGYMCVGWDEVGDLTAYATKDEFRAAFANAFPSTNGGHVSRKANELWALRDMEPGDIIVANRGTATVVGIGRVVEPGYQYRADRSEFRHTVAVDWYDTKVRTIEPVKKWAFSTVAPIPKVLYKRILGGEAEPTGIADPVDPLFAQLEDTMQRKRQVVLYGPPGTGKTYLARRFAVWWLSRYGDEDHGDVLQEIDAFRSAEEWLLTPSTRSAWWFVASPDRWQWQEMFDIGWVDYDRGRLEANYERLQVGDLVFGYEATPTLRIVALARVARWSEPDDGSGDLPVLEPICHVADGPTWDDIKVDATLIESEPVRNRSQGTLFAVTDEEAERLLEMIAVHDERAASEGRKARELPVGWLTNVTFHPSYTYEDFVEGFKPAQGDGVSGLRLALTDGIFMRVCNAARANPDVPHVLIIDEINRGNLPKIFGELLTVLECDKRGLDVMLPQSGAVFSVPDNVYIIGTMNTADRSVRLLDAALRRRFAFIELMPRSDLLEGATVGPLALDEFLEQLNQRIRERYGREKQVGHSYFLEHGQPLTEPETFARVMRDEVMPLLQEYAYDHYGDLEDLLGAGVVDSDNETLQQDIIGDPEAFVAALYEDFQGPNTASA